MIYIVVPTYNRKNICLNFIKAIENQSYQDYKLILVDHGKNKTGINEKKQLIVLESDVNGWARAINIGLRYVLKNASDEDYVLIINDDVDIQEDYLQSVYNSIRDKPGAIIGSCCINKKNGKTLRVAIKIDKIRAKNRYLYQKTNINEIPKDYIESDLLTGKGTVFPVKVLKNIGIYNEKLLPHYKADHELVWRAKVSGIEIYASKQMILKTFADQKRAVREKTLINNLKFMLFNMLSTYNLVDLYHYSFLCFNKLYGLYYFVINSIRYILGNIYLHFKSRTQTIESQ